MSVVVLMGLIILRGPCEDLSPAAPLWLPALGYRFTAGGETCEFQNRVGRAVIMADGKRVTASAWN
jgi:hypothetical protein